MNHDINHPFLDYLKKVVLPACIFAFVIGGILGFAAMLSGCNRPVIDTTYKFNYAYIELQNGTVIEGSVQSWYDYEDSDQLQIKIDGVTYLVHSSNCTLIYDPNK